MPCVFSKDRGVWASWRVMLLNLILSQHSLSLGHTVQMSCVLVIIAKPAYELEVVIAG